MSLYPLESKYSSKLEIVSDKKWFYSKSGEEYDGPISKKDLSSKIENGTISEDTLVWKEGFNEWKSISEIPGFEDLFEEFTPPPLPKRKDRDKNSTDFHKELIGSPKSYEEAKHNKEKFQSDLLGELPQQIKCPICEDNLQLAPKERIKKRFWCPTCKNDINEDILREHKGVNPKLFDNKSKESESISNSSKENNLENQDTLTHKWLKIYVNVRIPLGIFITLINILSPNNPIPPGQANIVYTTTAILIISYTFLFWGLYKRRLWGWKVNWGFILLEPILAAFATSIDPSQLIVYLILGLTFYSWPNYIYFKKRKYLFT